jgi:hypothetical protein
MTFACVHPLQGTGHTYNKKLFVVFLTFKLNQISGLHFIAAKSSQGVFIEALERKAYDLG